MKLIQIFFIILVQLQISLLYRRNLPGIYMKLIDCSNNNKKEERKSSTISTTKYFLSTKITCERHDVAWPREGKGETESPWQQAERKSLFKAVARARSSASG